MRTETFQNWYENTYIKGTYVVIEKITFKGEFTKLTRMVARFVNYYNIESVKAKGKSENESKPRDYEKAIIPHVLKENLNTQNTLLMVYKTNHHKAHSKYYYHDMEISEQEYYEQSGDKKKDYGDTPLFMFKMQDVLSVGGVR